MNIEREIKCAFTLEDIETEGINNSRKQMQRIYKVWIGFGLDLNIMTGRARIVWNHVQNLLKDVYVEENTFYELYKERVKNYKIKINELCIVLGMTPRDPVVAGSWISQEEMLKRELDNLTEIKRMRLKAYQELKTAELKHCQKLNLQEHRPPSNAEVPTEEDFFELEQRVKMLKDETERRQKNFDLARKELTTILEVTESSLESSLEEDIISDKDTLPLTDDTFRALQEVTNKAQKRKEELEVKKKILIEKLTFIWQILKVEENKRVSFLSKHADCRLSTIQSIEQEIEKCEAIESGNIGPYILSLRTELAQLWDKCYVYQPERDFFRYFSSTELSVEVLEAHKSEVDKWKQYFSKVEHILVKIDKRKLLWNTLKELENAANNPNRFRNSKRNMLNVWKDCKKLQKDLPALENNIFEDIDELKSKDGSIFLHNGEDFKTYVDSQWAEINLKKKNKKVEHHNKHSLKLDNEAVVKNPLKRTLSVNFPKSPQRKLLRSKTLLYNGNNFKINVSNQRAKGSNQKANEFNGHKKHFVQMNKDVSTPLKRTVMVNFSKTAPSKFFKSLKTMSPFHTPTASRSRAVPSTVARMASKPSIRPVCLPQKK